MNTKKKRLVVNHHPKGVLQHPRAFDLSTLRFIWFSSQTSGLKCPIVHRAAGHRKNDSPFQAARPSDAQLALPAA
jgi:hypothetical protein